MGGRCCVLSGPFSIVSGGLLRFGGGSGGVVWSVEELDVVMLGRVFCQWFSPSVGRGIDPLLLIAPVRVENK